MNRCTLTVAMFALLAFAAAAGAQEASALTAENLKAIVAEPHDDAPPSKGLETLSNVREWNASGHFVDPAGGRQPFKGKTTSKRVDGKYDVSQTTFEAPRVTLTMVTTWDAKSDVYYKYTMTGKGPPTKSIGMRVPGARAIAWAPVGGGMITVETYDDRKMSWRSSMIDKAGAVTLVTEGEATPAPAPAQP
jgi:hypothetical protein